MEDLKTDSFLLHNLDFSIVPSQSSNSQFERITQIANSSESQKQIKQIIKKQSTELTSTNSHFQVCRICFLQSDNSNERSRLLN